jgi:hypothetical protein
MEAIRSSETSVDTQQTTWRYIPEDGTLHNHHCEYLKSYIRNIKLETVYIFTELLDYDILGCDIHKWRPWVPLKRGYPSTKL